MSVGRTSMGGDWELCLDAPELLLPDTHIYNKLEQNNQQMKVVGRIAAAIHLC